MGLRARSHARPCRVALLAASIALLATGLATPVGAAPTAGAAQTSVTGAFPTDAQGRVTFRQTGAPYLNPHLPVAKRVEDLMDRMTLEEKVGQMSAARSPMTRRRSRR
jgi:beta-glucosidase